MLAATAVIGFFGIAVVAPFTANDATADVQFQERIHQRFVPQAQDEDPVIDLSISPLVQVPQRAPAIARPIAVPKYTGGGSPAEWMTAAGIPESEWGYVDYVVTRESGWNPNATNARSGACGLEQALPCSKVPGNGYHPIDNLRWADGYAKARYGGWSGAYEFWISHNWW